MRGCPLAGRRRQEAAARQALARAPGEGAREMLNYRPKPWTTAPERQNARSAYWRAQFQLWIDPEKLKNFSCEIMRENMKI
jgi:hypothetical protein